MVSVDIGGLRASLIMSRDILRAAFIMRSARGHGKPRVRGR